MNRPSTNRPYDESPFDESPFDESPSRGKFRVRKVGFEPTTFRM